MILWELTAIHKDATVMTEPEKKNKNKKKKAVEPWSILIYYQTVILINSRWQKQDSTQHQASSHNQLKRATEFLTLFFGKIIQEQNNFLLLNSNNLI